MLSQQRDLVEYADYLKGLDLGTLEPEDAIFCGAGDSLACALFIERLMDFKTRAFDPFDVVLYPEVTQDKKVFLISVSGRTRSNIQAARIASKRRGQRTTAITANAKSELAKACSDVIELKFTKVEGVQTPGTNSFTASLLACASLFKTNPNLEWIEETIGNARRWAESVAPARFYHFVGAGSFYAIAMYGAAKIFEFAGGRADYQQIEEFSHTNLFSLGEDNNDCVVILPFGVGGGKAHDLFESLKENGYTNIHLLSEKTEKRKVLPTAISDSIHLQFLALEVARRAGLIRPAFLEKKNLLEVSNRMIY
jgi:fructoselysine-6-P-deglycase FrlB-like protein